MARTARDNQFLRSLRDGYLQGRDGEPASLEADAEAPDEPRDGAEVDSVDEAAAEHEVTAALRGVDWAKVKAATAARTGAAAQRMRDLAKDVDWAKVQSGAAVVSSALIAGIASGQIPMTGRVTGSIARAIINDGNLAARVDATLAKNGGAPPDFRQVIETTATEGD